MKCAMNIKITYVVFSVLILQTSASFFDGFRDAFETVENSFGKLFNDVVYDVKETIDCTLMAVQQVFSFGGTFSHPSEYEKRCNGGTGQSEQTVPPPVVPPPELRYDYYTPPAEPRAQDTAKISHGIADEVKKELSQELNATMLNVNQTINELFDISGAHKEIEKVESALKNETDRLAEISGLLNKEINDLSVTVKSQLENLNVDRKRSTVNDVLKEVKLLHDAETSSKNATEVSEIRHVFDEVLGVLNAGNASKTLSNNDEVKKIVKDIKNMSNDTFTDIKKDISQWKKEEKKMLENIDTKNTNDLPKTFKDIAKKLFKNPIKSLEESRTGTPAVEMTDLETTDSETNDSETSDSETNDSETTDSETTDEESSATDDAVDGPRSTEISPSESATEITPNYDELPVGEGQPILEEPTDLSQLDPSVINSFFAPPSEESQKAAVKEAEELIEQSKLTDKIMNNFFNRPREDDKDVPNIFDNPDLLNFDDDY